FIWADVYFVAYTHVLSVLPGLPSPRVGAVGGGVPAAPLAIAPPIVPLAKGDRSNRPGVMIRLTCFALAEDS
ncbi:MAG: hypothetical protein AAGE59_16150, partial [Cyanobacteria bacterium P01_F01_bin.86]